METQTDVRHRSRTILEGRDRAPARSYPQRHGLLRRGPEQAHRRRCPLLDRDDALQLQPPPPGREGEGGHQGGRRYADGAQHHLHLRRHNDGNAGDEDEPRQPGGDRRLHRARRARPHVRRDGDDSRLRQDDPGRRDGPRQARRAWRHRLLRLHSPGPLQGPRRNDPGRLRGRRRQRGGQDVRRGPARPGGARLPRSGRLRRPVHGEHDGDGPGVPRPLTDGLGRPSSPRRPQGRGLRPRRKARHGVAGARPHARSASSPARPSRTASPPGRPREARPTSCCTCSR